MWPSWEEAFPLSKYATPSEAVLSPGDCAYVPVYWFHYVETSRVPAVALNLWRRPDPEKKDAVGRLLCGARHSKAAVSCGAAASS